jgi:hypothetical protein
MVRERNLAESSKEDYGSKRAALPVIIMMIIIIIFTKRGKNNRMPC